MSCRGCGSYDLITSECEVTCRQCGHVADASYIAPDFGGGGNLARADGAETTAKNYKAKKRLEEMAATRAQKIAAKKLARKLHAKAVRARAAERHASRQAYRLQALNSRIARMP